MLLSAARLSEHCWPTPYYSGRSERVKPIIIGRKQELVRTPIASYSLFWPLGLCLKLGGSLPPLWAADIHPPLMLLFSKPDKPLWCQVIVWIGLLILFWRQIVVGELTYMAGNMAGGSVLFHVFHLFRNSANCSPETQFSTPVSFALSRRVCEHLQATKVYLR